MVPSFFVIYLLVDIFNLHKDNGFTKLVSIRCADVIQTSGPRGFCGNEIILLSPPQSSNHLHIHNIVRRMLRRHNYPHINENAEACNDPAITWPFPARVKNIARRVALFEADFY